MIDRQLGSPTVHKAALVPSTAALLLGAAAYTPGSAIVDYLYTL